MAASNNVPKKKSKQLNISTIISGDGRPIRLGRLQEHDRSSGVSLISTVEPQPDSGPEDSQGNPSCDNIIYSSDKEGSLSKDMFWLNLPPPLDIYCWNSMLWGC